MPVILTTQEAEIRRISVLSKPRKILFETLSLKKKKKKKNQHKIGLVESQVVDHLPSKQANPSAKKIK
jgi:hypothetical protein